jgi:hypothetical protein
MEAIFYDVLVFATDIRTKSDLLKVSSALNENPEIHRWSIDQEDKDCVLRIESTLSENEIIELIISHKFNCAELE